MSEYVIKAASRGGWNKMHIWKVGTEFHGQVRLGAICRTGFKASPKPETWPKTWVNNLGKALLGEVDPLSDEKYADHCEKCARRWTERNEDGDV